MQVFYCAQCRCRVTSLDVESGRSVAVEGKVYCPACTRTLNPGACAPSAPAAAATDSRPGISPAAPVRMAARRPGPERTSASAREGSRTLIIAGLSGLILILLILVAAIIVRNRRAAAAPAPDPQPTVFAVPEDEEDVPAVVRERVPVQEPAPPVVPLPPEPPAAAAAERSPWTDMLDGDTLVQADGWHDLLAGGSLADAGWFADAGPAPDTFAIDENRTLVKAVADRTGSVSVYREGAGAWELEWAGLMSGSYADIGVFPDSGGHAKIMLDAGRKGRHTGRLIYDGRELFAFFDGRLCKDQFEIVKGSVFSGRLRVRLYAIAGTDIRIAAMRMRTLPPAPPSLPEGTVPVDLLAGDSLEHAGWEPFINDDVWGPGFALADGVLAVDGSPSKSMQISKSFEFRGGDLVVDYDFSGTWSWEFMAFKMPAYVPVFHLEMSKNENAIGRHTLRLTLTEDSILTYLDERLASGLLRAVPNGTWEGPCLLRIQTYKGARFRITRMEIYTH